MSTFTVANALCGLVHSRSNVKLLFNLQSCSFPSDNLDLPINSAIAEEAFLGNLPQLTSWLQSNLTTLSNELLSIHIITPEEQQGALTKKNDSNEEKTQNLLMVVQRRIKHNPVVFRNFVKAVESIPALCELADVLVKSYLGKY